MKIIIIGCGSKKKDTSDQAQYLYSGGFFTLKRKFAYHLNFDKKFIISGKYGLLHFEDIIEPYNISINKNPNKEQLIKQIIEDLSKETDLKNGEFTLIMGKSYYEPLLPYLKHYKIPTKGMHIVKQIKYISDYLNENQ